MVGYSAAQIAIACTLVREASRASNFKVSFKPNFAVTFFSGIKVTF